MGNFFGKLTMQKEAIDIPKAQLINIGKLGSSPLGFISVAENLPFEVKRVYWTYYAPHEVIRGHHAHKKLHQFIFAVSGIIKFDLENVLGEKNHFVLDSPELGLYIPPLHWRTIQFSHNAVLLCLASSIFDEADYIRDYTDFKNETGTNRL
jgi:dTDP-4-dehydrorhamnose 3,5-epimerase-like enzyme